MITWHKHTLKMNIEKRVRQGFTVLTKIFTACLESICTKLKWQAQGIHLNVEYLNNLKFPDDVTLILESMDEYHEMFTDLNKESLKGARKINKNKVKVMFDTNTQSNVIHIED